MPIGSGASVHLISTDSPDPRQRHFWPSNTGSYPTSYPRTNWRRCQRTVPGFLSPFGCRHSLLGSSCARWGVEPSLRSAYRDRLPDPIGVVVLRMIKLRPGRAPALPRGRWCAPSRRLSSGRHPPLYRGQSLPPRWNIPPAELTFTRRHHRFTHVRPSPPGDWMPPKGREAPWLPAGLLLACGPQVEQGPLRLEPRASHPAVTHSELPPESWRTSLRPRPVGRRSGSRSRWGSAYGRCCAACGGCRSRSTTAARRPGHGRGR